MTLIEHLSDLITVIKSAIGGLDTRVTALESSGGGSAPSIFVQQTRPSSAGPWHWWVTDATGNITNLIVNDGGA